MSILQNGQFAKRPTNIKPVLMHQHRCPCLCNNMETLHSQLTGLE